MNPIVSLLQDVFFAFSLSTIRLSVAFTVLPILGQGVIHGLVRMVTFASLSLVVVPHVYYTMPIVRPDTFEMIPIFLKEAFIGILIGFLASIFFWIAETIGFLIDNQRGSSMASAFDPMAGGESSPLGILIFRAVSTTFFVTGGFLSLLSVIYQSYMIWPVFAMIPDINIAFPQYILKLFDELLKMGALYAAPIMLLLFFAEFGLGLMNRFAQQLNVFILAMPVKSGLAMFLFVIYMEFLIDYFKSEFVRIPYILRQLEALLA